MANYLIIGTGKISSEIHSQLTKFHKVDVVALRNMSKITSCLIKKYDVVIFLGYNSFNLMVNLLAILKLVIIIRSCKPSVKLIYVSTQDVIIEKISTFDALFLEKYICTPYRFVKSVQGFIVKRLCKKYIIVYLPIVYGTNFDVHKKLYFISEKLHNKGLEKSTKKYYLNIDIFSKFLLERTCAKHDKSEIFIYSDFCDIHYLAKKMNIFDHSYSIENNSFIKLASFKRFISVYLSYLRFFSFRIKNEVFRDENKAGETIPLDMVILSERVFLRKQILGKIKFIELK